MGHPIAAIEEIKVSNRTLPAHNTQPARLLSLLIAGWEVDPLEGWREIGIYRLSDTVFRLKKFGWKVDTGKLEKKNRFGEVCRFANYSLNPESLEAFPITESERQFAASEMLTLAGGGS